MTKVITPQNWLEHDPSLDLAIAPSPESDGQTVSQQDWLNLCLEPRLLPSVPRELSRLYEGARGSMIYGYFYYALCMVGGVALIRVTEAAVAARCRMLGAPQISAHLDENLRWLAEQGAAQLDDWTTLLAARGYASRPQSGEVLLLLTQAAERINSLFPVR